MRTRSVAAVLSVFLIGSAVVATASAQDRENRIGVMGGLNLATVGGKGTTDITNKGNRTGFLAGAFAEIGINKNVAISPEAYYIGKGFKETDAGDELKLKLNYIEIPLLLKVLFPTSGTNVQIRPHLYAGPAIAFKSSCKVTGTVGGTSETLDCTDPNIDIRVKSTDFGVVAGAGIDIGPVFFGVRYDLGLADVNDTGASSNGAAHNRSLSFIGGASIPLPHH